MRRSSNPSRARLLLFLTLLISFPAIADPIPTRPLRPLMTLTGPAGDPMSMPSDVAVDADGIYVVDGARHRVLVFDPRGRFRFAIGGQGNGAEEFDHPVGITVRDGRLYIADTGNRRIQVFDTGGRYLRGIVTRDQGQAVPPVDVEVSAKGRELYVTSNRRHRVLAYSADGTLLGSWGGNGSNQGQFRYPASITRVGQGRLAVVDVLNTRVQVFYTDGKLSLVVGEWGVLPGQLFRPKGVAVDHDGRYYISDSYMNLVQVFNDAGEFLYVLGRDGEPRRFDTPTGIAVYNGRLYVVEMLKGRVSVFGLPK